MGGYAAMDLHRDPELSGAWQICFRERCLKVFRKRAELARTQPLRTGLSHAIGRSGPYVLDVNGEGMLGLFANDYVRRITLTGSDRETYTAACAGLTLTRRESEAAVCMWNDGKLCKYTIPVRGQNAAQTIRRACFVPAGLPDADVATDRISKFPASGPVRAADRIEDAGAVETRFRHPSARRVDQ